MTLLYGISHCDTVRRARAWLVQHEVDFSFYDVKKQPLPQDILERWARHVGWELLLNRRSTTWRGLPEADKASLNETTALTLLRTYPTLMKRPVLDTGIEPCVGFDAVRYQHYLATFLSSESS